jgi:hypothetical protein
MNDQETRDSQGRSGEVASEFKDLGDNLKSILQHAWESEERKNLQREIETGLANLGKTVDEAVTEFKQSDTGQRLKTEAQDLQQRIRSGEVEASLREDLLAALRKVNSELEKILSRKPGSGGEEKG